MKPDCPLCMLADDGCMTSSTFPTLLTSKYHSVAEVQNLKIEKDLNIFHSNVNGLESKYDTLHTFLNGARTAMDVIAIISGNPMQGF